MGIRLMLACAALGLAGAAVAAPADRDLVEQGRRIYVEGVLPSGSALEGAQAGDARVAGAAAACANCHRASGMGAVEGDIQIRPITGNYLFHRGRKNMATMDPRIGKRMNQAHDAYTAESLARAIRQGVNSDGQPMNPLMPKFALSDGDMKALQAYLDQLSSAWSPGVTANSIRFATVVAPGVDPARRKVFLDMLQAAVGQKNGSTLPGHRHMVSPAEMLGGTERPWALDVWELKGAPETWQAQLEAYYERQPVFAILSGLSETTWEPVAAFCNSHRLPNWFPSVDAAPAATGGYTLYFSRGVAAEADVLAKHVSTAGQGARPRRIVQVYRHSGAGPDGAGELRRALEGSGIEIADRAIDGAGAKVLAHALRGLDPRRDAVMLWLSPADLAALDEVAAPRAPVYVSGRMARGQSAPLPQAWKAVARLVYPYQLPDRLDANLATFRTWMNVRRFARVDEAMQDEVFFAVTYMTLTVSEMLDNLYRDYLIERAENMLSLQEKTRSLDETRMRAVAGRPGAMIAHYGEASVPEGIHRATLELVTSVKNVQTGTSVYPHLSLAPGQRFASKGACIVRFADPAGNRLVAESDWIIP